MGFEVGDLVELKEKFAGRKYRGRVKKIQNDIKGEKILVVSQPQGLTANFPVDLWIKVEEEENDV